MTDIEAIAEAKRRWPESELHNAYVTRTTTFPAGHESKIEYHVVAYHPFHGGTGPTYEAAFQDAERRDGQ